MSMFMLIVASCVHWGKTGNGQLRNNWQNARSADGTRTQTILRQIFYGVCLGMLGLTGFECQCTLKKSYQLNSNCLFLVLGTPSYISRIKPRRFPSVLRNLHLPAIVLNTVIMLLVLAVIPLDVVLSGANILSVLAYTVSLDLFVAFVPTHITSVRRALVANVDCRRCRHCFMWGSANW